MHIQYCTGVGEFDIDDFRTVTDACWESCGIQDVNRNEWLSEVSNEHLPHDLDPQPTIYFRIPQDTDHFTLTKLHANGSLTVTNIINRVETRDDAWTHSSEAEQTTGQHGTQTTQPSEPNPAEDMMYEDAYPLPETSSPDLLCTLRQATPQTTAEQLTADLDT